MSTDALREALELKIDELLDDFVAELDRKTFEDYAQKRNTYSSRIAALAAHASETEKLPAKWRERYVKHHRGDEECCCCSMRRDRVRASRHNSLLAQRFELAALLVDVSAHVGGNGLESRVAVQRLPEGIVIKGVPPLHVEP